MIEKQGRIENARWVEGDLGVHFVYTAGIAGEEFLRALARGKVLASTCDSCGRTYCPPRIFCEPCFAEIGSRREIPGTGTVAALTRLEVDAEGKATEPEWVAAIRLDGTDSTLLHRVAEGVAVGDRVEPVWAPKRTGTILDIQRFRAAAAKPRERVAKAAAVAGNGKPAAARRRAVAVRRR